MWNDPYSVCVVFQLFPAGLCCTGDDSCQVAVPESAALLPGPSPGKKIPTGWPLPADAYNLDRRLQNHQAVGVFPNSSSSFNMSWAITLTSALGSNMYGGIEDIISNVTRDRCHPIF